MSLPRWRPGEVELDPVMRCVRYFRSFYALIWSSQLPCLPGDGGT
jgi:hypothetical protein